MMVAMSMMGGVANESDVDRSARVVPREDGALSMAVLMNGRDGSMLVPGMQRGKNETHGQEYEKAGNKAVPFHDPEQRA